MKLSKRVGLISPSPTLGVTSKARQMKAQGIDVVSLGAGEPDFDTPGNIKSAAITAIKDGFTKYTPSSGIAELKVSICDKLKRENGLIYKPEQIVISCGAKHALYNILQSIIDETDEVLIMSPYWVSYPEMVRLAGGVPVIVQTQQENGFKTNSTVLKKYITKKTKVLILNSPSNPTGLVYSREELSDLANFVLDAGILVISDEIYEKIIYEGEHISIASLGKEIYDSTVVVNGVSKTYSMTGWRIGYMAGPLELSSAVGMLQDHSTSNPTSISQKAALEAISSGQDFVKDMVSEFKKRRDYIIKRIGEIKPLKVVKPQGAFYCFVDISSCGLNSVEFAQQLLEKEKVAVIPGEGFGFDTHIRLSFATSMDNIKKAMDRIERFVKGI